MSFIVGICLFLGLLAGAVAHVLFRRRMWISLTAGLAVIAASFAWFLSPVCVAIAQEDLASFDPPIETRTETGMIGQRYFQQHDGVWYQCKVRMARQLFF